MNTDSKMNIEYIKLQYGITCWPDHKLNYWGIPKCGSTSVLWMLHSDNDPPVDFDPTWIHRKQVVNYIDKGTALSNGFKNFATIRNPYTRVESMWKDFCNLRPTLLPKCSGLSFIEFINNIIVKSTDTLETNIHLRSQCYFIGKRIEDDYGYDYEILVNLVDIDHSQKLVSIMPRAVPPLRRLHTTDAITQPIWNDDIREAVKKRYNNDFEFLGFHPETGQYLKV